GTTVGSVSVVIGTPTISVGAQTQATATARDPLGNALTGLPVAWTSSNSAVARIDASTGIVTGVAAGTSTISATTAGITGTATVTVVAPAGPAPVASVSVSLAASSIPVGGTTQATAVARDASGNVLTGRALVWSTSNPTVVTVDGATGLITGAGAGSATITGTSEGKSGTASITVTSGSTPPPTPPPAPVATVSVSITSSSIVVGATTQATATTKDASGNVLTGRTIAWSSSDATIATVDAVSGLVSGVNAGTATITATSEGKVGSIGVTVTLIPVATVTVSLAPSTIVIGGTSQATATARDASGNVLAGRPLAWSSSNSAIANVDAGTGTVTGVAAGTATIIATSGGKSGVATVTVTTVPVATVTVQLAANTLVVGGSTTATATTTDASGA